MLHCGDEFRMEVCSFRFKFDESLKSMLPITTYYCMSIIIVALTTSQSYVVKITHLSYPWENQF